MKSLKPFLVLWISQFASSLGSAMVSFAVTIWAYAETGSVLALSLSGVAILLPKMVGGILAGPLVDRLNKKAVMMAADAGAGLCSVILFFLLRSSALEMWHIYCLNICNSLFGSFQTPANNVVISAIVPKRYYVRASGLQSFATGAVEILSPALAAVLLAAVGMAGVILFDLLALAAACVVLLCMVKIPDTRSRERSLFRPREYGRELAEGFRFVAGQKLLIRILLLFLFINFAAGMTYYNLLSPMILARTDHNAAALAWVNGAIGLGGMAGGLMAVVLPSPAHKTRAIFFSVGLSFLLGDILLAVGSTLEVWVCAAFLSSVPLPYMGANESYLWRTRIPIPLQGRAFALKFAFQSGPRPMGILMGGLLADRILEPGMLGANNLFTRFVGNAPGSGMALLFLLTGAAGTLISLWGWCSPALRRLEKTQYSL